MRPSKVQKKQTRQGKVRQVLSKKRTPAQVDISVRLTSAATGDRDSIIYIGNLVEQTLRGPFGEVIRALTAGRIDIELRENREGKLSAERVLGRCEMATVLWHDLEQFVHDKDAAVRPIKETNTSESHMAEDPEPSRDVEDALA